MRRASIPAAVRPSIRARTSEKAVASRSRFWTSLTVASESASDARKRRTVSVPLGRATSA
jgi:hypothetical protein